MRWTNSLIVAGAIMGAGCGDGAAKTAPGGGDGGQGTSGGSSATGSAPSAGGWGGSASGGDAGAAATTTGGTNAVPGSCTPAQRLNPPSQECPDYNPRQFGIPLDEPGVTVTSVLLPTSMVGGTPYALSLVTEAGEADVQLWGTNEDCGPSLEAFPPSDHLTPGVRCWSFIPHSPHTRLLIVRHNLEGYVSGDLQVCALGDC